MLSKNYTFLEQTNKPGKLNPITNRQYLCYINSKNKVVPSSPPLRHTCLESSTLTYKLDHKLQIAKHYKLHPKLFLKLDKNTDL